MSNFQHLVHLFSDEGRTHTKMTLQWTNTQNPVCFLLDSWHFPIPYHIMHDAAAFSTWKAPPPLLILGLYTFPCYPYAQNTQRHFTITILLIICFSPFYLSQQRTGICDLPSNNRPQTLLRLGPPAPLPTPFPLPFAFTARLSETLEPTGTFRPCTGCRSLPCLLDGGGGFLKKAAPAFFLRQQNIHSSVIMW